MILDWGWLIRFYWTKGKSAKYPAKMEPVTIRPWRTSPFKIGLPYRVQRCFTGLRDNFQAGEVLVYDRDAYSCYDGYTGYFFFQPETQQMRSWDIHDDEQPDIWRDLFEEVRRDDKPGKPNE